MANAAIDPDAHGKDMGDKPRALFVGSREELARQIYGDPARVRNLNRPISDLRNTGLIIPSGPDARKGHAQEYRICVYEAVALHYEELSETYRRDAQELGRILRMVNTPDRTPS